jgi:predicted secreted protein
MKIALTLLCAMVAIALGFCAFSSSSAPSPGLALICDATVEVTCDVFDQQPHHSADVQLGADGTLTVILCSNPTTGFQWSQTPQIGNQTVLRQVDHRFVPREDAALVGAPGQEVWIFKTLKKGTSTIYFEYSRPWEGGEKAIWTFNLTVIVK